MPCTGEELSQPVGELVSRAHIDAVSAPVSRLVGQFVSFRAVLRLAMLCHETWVGTTTHSFLNSINSCMNRVTAGDSMQ